MLVFHFITPKEHAEVNRPGKPNGEVIAEFLAKYPEAKEEAEKFFNFLKTEEENRKAYEEKNGTLYSRKPEIIPENVSYYDKKQHVTKIAYICLERVIGELMYGEYMWNSAEVQEAYTKSKTAAADWYKQFEKNPDGKIDVLTSISDPVIRAEEEKKIDRGIIRGKYENQ